MDRGEAYRAGEQVGMGRPDMDQVFGGEALRVVIVGEEQGMHLRVIGALAFWHHCPEYGYQEKLGRVYTDIDFAGYGKQNDAIRKLFVSIGYDEDLEINAFHAEGGRLIFNNPTSHIHVDVFMNKLDFCHPIPWKARLEVDSPTIPLAELLLEKMQIVKVNEKDIIDTIMLLLEHDICGDDEDHINSQHVAKLCAAEWRLWRTSSMNLEKVRDYLPHLDLEEDQKQVVTTRVSELLSGMERLPQGALAGGPRQGRRQSQVVTRPSTRRRRRMAFVKKRKGGGRRVRLFYATDLHGSERTYRKFVNAAKFYKVDHLVMGGDIMGKFLIPIIDEGDGHFRVTLQDELRHFDGGSAAHQPKANIETLGFYHVTVTEDELREMHSDQSLVDAAFEREAHARLERWIALADERLAGTDIMCYITGGNDDPQDLLDVLEHAHGEHVINCDGKRL
jgi:hypothetical protein